MTIFIITTLLIITLFIAFSVRFTFWRRSIDGIPVLMYHRITDEKPQSKLKKLLVTTDRFAAQMSYLHTHGYSTITIDEFISILNGKWAPSFKPVIITFDDGYKDNYTYAFTILKEYGFNAIIFLVTKYIGDSNLWDEAKGEPITPLLSWSEILEMKEHGIEFGSHGHTHSNLTEISEREQAFELEESKRVLEKELNQKIKAFSYPFGIFNESTLGIIGRSGYCAAFTTKPGKNNLGDDLFRVKRIMVKRSDNMLDFVLKLKKGKSRL
ncbi:MAG: polysaccharide deacetylase family protein [Desulfobacterales bacterium]|nr:polysaccharide deacetylase family protein [Desulfobacterales bacterium]